MEKQDNPIMALYRDRVKREGEELLLKGFPETIHQLNLVLATSRFKKRNLSDIHCPTTNETGDNYCTNKRPRTDLHPQCIRIKSNPHLGALIDVVKPHMIKLVEDTKKMKMWVALMIPKMEDGNNFGVAIQEDTLLLAQSIETVAKLFYERITNYYIDRARLVKSTEKYPDIDDFRKAVEELDEKEYLGMCMALTEIRNDYCTLYDTFTKNLEKIKKPKNNMAVEALY